MGRQLLQQLAPSATQNVFANPLSLRRVQAYQGDEIWVRATTRDYLPVVPPHPHRKQPWTYDLEPYPQRHEVALRFHAAGKATGGSFPGWTS